MAKLLGMLTCLALVAGMSGTLVGCKKEDKPSDAVQRAKDEEAKKEELKVTAIPEQEVEKKGGKFKITVEVDKAVKNAVTFTVTGTKVTGKGEIAKEAKKVEIEVTAEAEVAAGDVVVALDSNAGHKASDTKFKLKVK